VVVDTSVLVAGIAGFREPFIPGRNPSADVLQKWAEKGNFIWLVTENILDEYKEVLKRLGVRRNLMGRVISLIRERAEEIKLRSSIEISPDRPNSILGREADMPKVTLMISGKQAGKWRFFRASVAGL
jgi:predicted nucleic acid-binding protein